MLDIRVGFIDNRFLISILHIKIKKIGQIMFNFEI
jgi:hypothetical protein